jgi:hypothetical protein
VTQGRERNLRLRRWAKIDSSARFQDQLAAANP